MKKKNNINPIFFSSTFSMSVDFEILAEIREKLDFGRVSTAYARAFVKKPEAGDNQDPPPAQELKYKRDNPEEKKDPKKRNPKLEFLRKINVNEHSCNNKYDLINNESERRCGRVYFGKVDGFSCIIDLQETISTKWLFQHPRKISSTFSGRLYGKTITTEFLDLDRQDRPFNLTPVDHDPNKGEFVADPIARYLKDIKCIKAKKKVVERLAFFFSLLRDFRTAQSVNFIVGRWRNFDQWKISTPQTLAFLTKTITDTHNFHAAYSTYCAIHGKRPETFKVNCRRSGSQSKYEDYGLDFDNFNVQERDKKHCFVIAFCKKWNNIFFDNIFFLRFYVVFFFIFFHQNFDFQFWRFQMSNEDSVASCCIIFQRWKLNWTP